MWSFKTILLRYIGVVAIITLPGLFANHTRGIFVIIPVSIVCIKFLLYDVLARVIQSMFPRFRAAPWLLSGYIVTVVADMFYTYQAALDEPDAGFAFFAKIMITPWVLAATLAMMLAVAFLTRKKQAKP